MLELGVVLVLVLLNGVFALSELAVVSARRSRLRAMAEAGRPGARAALALAEDPGALPVHGPDRDHAGRHPSGARLTFDTHQGWIGPASRPRLPIPRSGTGQREPEARPPPRTGSAVAPDTVGSLDHLVGAGEERGRDRDTDRPRGFQVDRRARTRSAARSAGPRALAPQDPVRVGGEPDIGRALVRAVARKSPRVAVLAPAEHRGQAHAPSRTRRSWPGAPS